jgi:hypothetical protein
MKSAVISQTPPTLDVPFSVTLISVFRGDLTLAADFGLAQTGLPLAIPMIDSTRAITTRIGMYFFIMILLKLNMEQNISRYILSPN